MSNQNAAFEPNNGQENVYINTVSLDESMCAVEDHYLPMTSAKRSLLSRSPQPLPMSSFSSSKTEFEENAYVEMQDGDGRKSLRTSGDGKASVFAGILDPSYRTPESPRYSEISDCQTQGDHYEFIYKASTVNAEPVYMEVPQMDEVLNDSLNALSKHSFDIRNSNTDIAENFNNSADCSAAKVNGALENTSQQLQQSQQQKQLEEDDASRDLDLIVPPRHPRFSISDTFRPASYFLNASKQASLTVKSKRLETIASREDIDFEGHESSDSDLVSPPPIPSSPPPMEDFATSTKNADVAMRLRGSFNGATPVGNSSGIVHSRSQSLDMNNDNSSLNESRFINSTSSQINACVRSSHSSLINCESLSKLNSTQEVSKRRPLTVVRSLEDLLVDTDHLNSSSPSMNSVANATPVPAFRGSTQSLTLSAKSASVLDTTWHNHPLYENVHPHPSASFSSPNVEHQRANICSPESSAGKPMHSTPVTHQRGNSTLSTLSLASSASTSSITRSEQNGAPYYYSDLLGKPDADKMPQSGNESEISSGIIGTDRESGSHRNRAANSKHNYSIDRLRTVHHNPRDFYSERLSPSLRTDINRRSNPATTSPDYRTQLASSEGVNSWQDAEEVNRLHSLIVRNHLERNRMRSGTPDLLANSSLNVSLDAQDTAEILPRNGQVMRRVRSLEGLLEDEVECKTNTNSTCDVSSNSMNNTSADLQVKHSIFSAASSNNNMGQQTLATNSNMRNGIHHASRSEISFASVSTNGRPLPMLKESPRYARDPTSRARPGSHNNSTNNSTNNNHINRGESARDAAEFSAWDEDRLWRDKLRRASIRHTRSMEMLDEIHTRKPRLVAVQQSEEETRETISPNDEGDRYERLLQYSATLERTKRGQTYLDGYMWDEMEQRFKKPEQNEEPNQPVPSVETTNSNCLTRNNTSNHFLDDSLPPTFEIDREKLRQWDLMSTAPVLSAAETGKEGGRLQVSNSNTSVPVSQANTTTSIFSDPAKCSAIEENDQSVAACDHRRPEEKLVSLAPRQEASKSTCADNRQFESRPPLCLIPTDPSALSEALHPRIAQEMSLHIPDLTAHSNAPPAKAGKIVALVSH